MKVSLSKNVFRSVVALQRNPENKTARENCAKILQSAHPLEVNESIVCLKDQKSMDGFNVLLALNTPCFAWYLKDKLPLVAELSDVSVIVTTCFVALPVSMYFLKRTWNMRNAINEVVTECEQNKGYRQ
jgi:hypothetical protein